jgi:hypothetical protein
VHHAFKTWHFPLQGLLLLPQLRSLDLSWSLCTGVQCRARQHLPDAATSNGLQADKGVLHHNQELAMALSQMSCLTGRAASQPSWHVDCATQVLLRWQNSWMGGLHARLCQG